MQFQRLIDRPNVGTLTDVLNGRRLDLIAPFARRGPMDRLNPASHDRVRIIVRLPKPTDPLPKKLDNDPRDFVRLVERMGAAAQVFGMPKVHTKLYLNGARAFYGSANFTNFGFGNNPESILETDDPLTYGVLSTTFSRYLGLSARLNLPYLRALARRFDRGEFTYIATPEDPVPLQLNPHGDDEAHFRNWLAAVGEIDADYIEQRFDLGYGYAMTGHTQSAFPGIRSFLRENLDLVPTLAASAYVPRQFWLDNPAVVQRFRNFVLTEGHRFPANGGGDWRRKLPPSLGGFPAAGAVGGRGAGLIARMLIFLARYAVDHGF